MAAYQLAAASAILTKVSAVEGQWVDVYSFRVMDFVDLCEDGREPLVIDHVVEQLEFILFGDGAWVKPRVDVMVNLEKLDRTRVTNVWENLQQRITRYYINFFLKKCSKPMITTVPTSYNIMFKFSKSLI